MRFGGTNRKSDQHTLSTNIKEKILMRVSSAALFKFLNWKMFSEEICEIERSRKPCDKKFTEADAVTDPVVAHGDGF